jgi:hypothetical protein
MGVGAGVVNFVTEFQNVAFQGNADVDKVNTQQV